MNSNNPSEIIHSSNVAHLGMGSSSSLAEQLKNMMKMNQCHTKCRADQNAKLQVEILGHRSEFKDASSRRDDVLARKVFSNNGHGRFLMVHKGMMKLECLRDEERQIFSLSAGPIWDTINDRCL